MGHGHQAIFARNGAAMEGIIAAISPLSESGSRLRHGPRIERPRA